MTTYAYCRVSTDEQDTENQIMEIRNAGFALHEGNVICETISGATEAYKRPFFKAMAETLWPGDVLIVTKLDRLGRSAVDVSATVHKLALKGVRVHCLALGGADLTSSVGKLTMGIIAAVAEFERDILVERTKAGLERARVYGRRGGRPPALKPDKIDRAKALLAEGVMISDIAKELKCDRSVIARLKAKVKG